MLTADQIEFLRKFLDVTVPAELVPDADARPEDEATAPPDFSKDTKFLADQLDALPVPKDATPEEADAMQAQRLIIVDAAVSADSHNDVRAGAAALAQLAKLRDASLKRIETARQLNDQAAKLRAHAQALLADADAGLDPSVQAALVNDLETLETSLTDPLSQEILMAATDMAKELEARVKEENEKVVQARAERAKLRQEMLDRVAEVEPHENASAEEKETVRAKKEAVATALPENPDETQLSEAGKIADELTALIEAQRVEIAARAERLKAAGALLDQLVWGGEGFQVHAKASPDKWRPISDAIGTLQRENATLTDWANAHTWGDDVLTALTEAISRHKASVVKLNAETEQLVETFAKTVTDGTSQIESAALSDSQKEAYLKRIEDARQAADADFASAEAQTAAIKAATETALKLAKNLAPLHRRVKAVNLTPASALPADLAALKTLHAEVLAALNAELAE